MRKADLRRWLLPAAALVFIAGFFFLCRSRLRTEFPALYPRDGVLDAREVDFDADVYHLVNQWDYYPGHLYEPADFTDPEAAPAAENEKPLDAELGTWRLVLLAEPDKYLALCHFSIDYGTRIFVNGREIRNIGFVSADPAEAAAQSRYVTLPLYTGAEGRVEILYQYSNFVHNDGGFIQKTLISTPENIDEYQRGLTIYSLFTSCGLIFLLFYFLLCAAFQRSPEYAALALCCLVIAFRNHLFFTEYLLEPGYDFSLFYRLVILDVSWIPATAIVLLSAFFPKAVGQKGFCLFCGCVLALTAAHFIVGTRSLVAVCHISYYACLPFAVWFVGQVFRSFRREKRGALEAFTLAAILFFAGMLIREGITSGSSETVAHFGLTPLAMIVAILVLAIIINARIREQALQLQEVRQQNELLGRVNAMNKDFLRTVAHELKTPLTVISGYAQLIGRQMEKDQLSEQTPERLQMIRQEADRLGEMVTRLMDYTYGHAQSAEMGAVDVQALLDGTVAVMDPVCAKRHNTLTVRRDGVGAVYGNAELLLQVLVNLIVNASRHTEEGRITVEVRPQGAFAVFTVTDTGSGITPEIIPHIFEKGFSTDESHGLGLAICRETVEAHGGTLELVSTGPEGTAFRFTVPKEGV